MPFEKGISGNPMGKKTGTLNKTTKELRNIFREEMDLKELVKSLKGLAKEGNLQAVRLLLEYGYGKPQGIEAEEIREELESFGM